MRILSFFSRPFRSQGSFLFLLFLVGFSQNQSFAQSADNRAAAIIDNQIITNQQVSKGIENQLYEAEMKVYELKYNQLRNLMLNKIIQSDPLSKGMTADAFLKKYVIKKIMVTDDEIEQLIKTNRVPAEKITADFKSKVREYLSGEKTRKQVTDWLDAQSLMHKITVNITKPKRPRSEIAINGAPVWGNANAPITIVEYSDFQCPYCARSEKTIKQLKKNYPGKIKIVYKQYPLGFHANAFTAAKASLCANEQSTEAFWKLHDHMFNNQKKLAASELKLAAKELGLNSQQFDQCIDSNKYQKKIDQEIAEGSLLGVQATPMFFVNGITIRGAQPYPVFAKLIEEELK